MDDRDIDDFFFEEDYLAAQGYLRMAQDYRQHPQELTNEDFWNMLDSVRWCYDNKQWQMMVDFVLSLCNFFNQRNFWQEGILCVRQAIKADKQLGKTRVRPQFAFELGLLYDRQGQLAKAKKYYKASATLADQFDQNEVLAEALHRLGWMAHSQRNYSAAETYYHEAMAQRDPQDVIGHFRSLHQLGILAQDQSNYNEAERLHKEGLQLVRDKEDSYLIAASLHQLGVLEVKQHHWPEARQYFEEELDIRMQIHDLYGQAVTLHELGIVTQEQGDFLAAYKNYSRSQAITAELNDWLGLIRTEMQLGTLALARNNLDDAQTWLQDSLHKSQVLGEGYLEGKTRLQLGVLHYRKREYNQALEHLRCSLELLPKYERTQREWASCLYQLGLIAQDQHQVDTAEHYYLRSLEIQELANFQLDAAQTRLQLGMLSHIKQHFVEAQQYYHASYLVFKVGGPRFSFHLAQVNHFLGDIEEVNIKKANGQRDVARNYYQEALRLYQRLSLPQINQLIEAAQAALRRLDGD